MVVIRQVDNYMKNTLEVTFIFIVISTISCTESNNKGYQSLSKNYVSIENPIDISKNRCLEMKDSIKIKKIILGYLDQWTTERFHTENIIALEYLKKKIFFEKNDFLIFYEQIHENCNDLKMSFLFYQIYRDEGEETYSEESINLLLSKIESIIIIKEVTVSG